MDLQLTGKRAVVTGASRGIGYAVADALAAEGTDVVLVARHQDDLDAAAERIRRHGQRALAVTADTTDDAAVRAMIATTVTELGGVDILVNAAASRPGRTRPGGWPNWLTTTFGRRSRRRFWATCAPRGQSRRT